MEKNHSNNAGEQVTETLIKLDDLDNTILKSALLNKKEQILATNDSILIKQLVGRIDKLLEVVN